jgi:hypothetical protein
MVPCQHLTEEVKVAFTDRKAVGMRGWKDAVDRLKGSWVRNDEDASMVALAEALMWLDALNEWFAKTSASWAAATKGSVVEGAVYARHRAVHDLAVLLRLGRPHEPYTDYYIDSYTALNWKTFDEIDRPPPEFVNLDQGAAYERHLGGKPVMDIISQIDQFLDSNAP